LFDCIQENEITGFSRATSNPYKVYNRTNIELENSCDKFLFAENHSSESKLVKRFQIIRDSIESLIANAPKNYIKNLYRNKKDLSEKEKAIIEFEIKNDIVFPAIYRDYLINPESYTIIAKFKHFNFFTLDSIQFTGSDGWDANPKAKKSIGIADDGVGDYLALFLAEGSPHHLGTEVYSLMYGGDIIRMGDLEALLVKK